MSEEYEEPGLSPEEINDMEEKRIDKLNEAGVDELDVLKNANEHLNIWNNYFNENIVRGKDDVNFCIRDQWTAIERSEFSRLFKPAMTANKLYGEVKKVAGEQRKNRPDLMVRSLTGKASQDQINLRSDLVRTISYQSQSDLVYQTAANSALMMGFGAFQVGIDYEANKSFKQIITLEEINDAANCSWDPSAVKPHKGDGNWCSRNHVYSKEEFAATYPYVINPISYEDTHSLLNFTWATKDTLIVCDYYVKEWYPCVIYKLSNGEVVTEQEWKDMQPELKRLKALAADSQIVGKIILDEIPHITSERQTQDYKIMHYRLIKNQIIDFAEWPSKYLPIIFVDGDSYYIQGRQYTKSFIHEARDSQKFLNYVMSEIAAEIKNRRREQWIGTPDNIVGNEMLWRNPELQTGILIAKPDPKTGAMPAKMNAWDLSPALMTNMQRAGQDIREILGVSESEQVGGRDISGVARRERKLEGAMSSYIFNDNLNQAIAQGGRVILDLLPAVMGDEERHMVVSQVNGESKSIVLNKKNADGSIENDLTGGDYDVEIDAGPSYAVQKEIALEFFQQTIAANPQVFNLVADLWATNLDIEQMNLVKDRLKNLVPPEILAKEAGEPPPPPKPDPQAMLMQAELKEKEAKIQNEMHKIQVSEHKLQLDQQRLELDRMRMMMEMKEVKMRTEQDERDHELDLLKVEKEASSKMLGHAIELHKHNNESAKDKITKTKEIKKPKKKASI